MNITEPYAQHVQTHPEKRAIVTENEQVTYREFHENVKRTAYAFTQMSVKNKRVFIYLPNDILFLTLFAAASQAGWASIIGDIKWKKPELESRIEQTTPDIIIAHPKKRHLFKDVSVKVIFTDELANWLTSKNAVKELPTGNSPFYIGFTSGSTGEPKAFMRSHLSWIASFPCNQHDLELTKDETVLIPGSFASSTFIYGAMSTLFDGGTVYLLKKFSAKKVITLLNTYPISLVYVVPTMLQALINEGYQSESVATFISTGAKLLLEVKQNFRKNFPQSKIHEFYGASELSFVSYLKDNAPEIYHHSVGKPFHNVEISIRNEDGSDVIEGEEGLLYVKSDMVFDEYLHNPVETNKVFAGEWATVQDLAKIDAAGYLYILGRKNDMILSGGHNIYPQEIEKVLLSIEGVKQACVIGVPDDYLGEKVVAYIQGEVDFRQLKTYCQKQLSTYKIPRVWERVMTFPKTSGGKIARQELKKQWRK